VVQHFDEIRNAQRRANSTAPRSERRKVAQTKPTENARPETERDILLCLVHNPLCTDGLLSQQLNLSIERIRFHLEELEKDKLIYGKHFYGGRPSEWHIAQEGRRYLFERNLLP
jgi:predicted ArsR family transcriptional regulator